MVAQRFTQQLENLSALKDLVDLVKNPSAIVSAHEEARNQMSLTSELEKKVEEAKDYIKQHASLVMQLDRFKSDLNSERCSFEDFVSKTKASLEEKENNLKSLSESLSSKAALQSAKDAAHAEERNALEAAKSSFEKYKLAALDKANAEDIKNTKDKDANDAKASNLALLEASLKAKAAKLRGAAEDI